jgi:hypothetical protein
MHVMMETMSNNISGDTFDVVTRGSFGLNRDWEICLDQYWEWSTNIRN